MNIGINIRNRRKELNMTQEQLADKMGYKSKSSINKIEIGENDIPQSKIVRFAEALHTTPAYLMGWDQDAIAAISEAETEADKYCDQAEAELKKILDDIRDLMLTKEELQDVLKYAKFVKSQRGNE